MKEWEVGDPIGMGNDAGVPDIPYLGYLNNGSSDEDMSHTDYGGHYYRRDDHKKDSEKENTPKGPSFNDYLNKAQKFSKEGDYSKAVKFYDLALEKLPRNRDASLGKAICLEKLGKKHEAAKCYFDASYLRAYSSRDDEVMLAVKYLKKAVEFDPDNDEALTNLGIALSRLKRYSEAITYYKRVKNKTVFGNVDWKMAQCYMKMNQYQEAIGLLDSCLEEEPLRGDWLCQKCECLFKVGRKDEAITEFKSFIDFVVGEDCYYKAIYMIGDLSKKIGDVDFFREEKEEYMENKMILYNRFQSVLDAVKDYLALTFNGLDESELPKGIKDDLEGFIKHISDKSGESIDNILKWYNMPFKDEFKFNERCNKLVYKYVWLNIIQMNEEGKFEGL